MGEGSGSAGAARVPADGDVPRAPESVEACRRLIVRIFGETLPEITRSYRLVPDGMAKLVIREYLSSERKQDTMVNFFLNSKVFQRLTAEEKKSLSICDSDDFLFGLESYITLPKVKVIRDILRENEVVFEQALQRGKRRAGWV